jgi:hypothetical protein
VKLPLWAKRYFFICVRCRPRKEQRKRHLWRRTIGCIYRNGFYEVNSSEICVCAMSASACNTSLLAFWRKKII